MHPIVQKTCWQATVVALAVFLGGTPQGLSAAIAITLLQLGHCIVVRGAAHTLDVQVRTLVLAVLVLAALAGWQWLAVIQLAGLLAMLVADFCLASRLLVLLPWNRDVPLTAALVRWVLFSPPRAGSIAARLPRHGFAGRVPGEPAA